MGAETAEKTPVIKTSGPRLRGTEGIRGFFSLLVVLVHVALTLPAAGHGPTGRWNQFIGLSFHALTMFFVLSAFLLYLPYVRHVLVGRRVLSSREYYLNRFLRVAPAYVVIFVFCALVLGSVVIAPLGRGDTADSVTEHLGRMTDPIDFLLNLTLLQGYVPSGVRTGMMVSWSLVPEIGFYLVLPLLAFVAMKMARFLPKMVALLAPAVFLVVLGRLTAMICGAIAGSKPLDMHTQMLYGESWNAVVYNALPGQAHIFGVGMAIAVFYVAAVEGVISTRTVSVLRWLCVVVLALGVVRVVVDDTAFGTLTGSIVCGAFLAWLVLPSPSRQRRWAEAVLESRPLQFVGLISLSLYLWHFPIIAFAYQHLDFMVYDSTVGMLISLAVTLAVSIPLSWLTFRWVELPAMQRKKLTRST
jgi:peptidoglycan/LPS O-acetylase OafA/YrhL